MGVTKEISKGAPAGAAKPVKGQTVTVHCTGIVKATGKKFWSTKDPGQTVFSFVIGRGEVIKGWDEGVATMSIGEHATLTCSPDYAYGPNGFPAWGIPPNAVLDFEIELLSVK
jgi:FKBP-type peptidyl-prolyl cis-trans isomerase